MNIDLKKEIKGYAEEIGIDIIRFTGVEPLIEEAQILLERQKRGLISGFEAKDLEKRTDVKKIFPQVQSIIVIGISYISEDNNESFSAAGKIARYARVKDYHKVLRNKMSKIIEFISAKLSYIPEHHLLVDTSPLLERAVAKKAGIGFLGYNASIINKEYGSFIALGEILIDLKFAADLPADNTCEKCMKCIQNCPANALIAPYTVDSAKCLAYWTQARGDIPREIRPLLQDRIVGCDTCQENCPHNREVKLGNKENFPVLKNLQKISLQKILQMTNKEFKAWFGDSAASWVGKRVLQRNALIAMGNSGNFEYIDCIIPCLKDERPQIRLHAAWALGRLGGERAIDILQTYLDRECDINVKKEIIEALKDARSANKKASGK